MRHGKKFNHLGRTATHRKAMLSNMASSLIINKRITTTVAKAKALRKYVEPLITKSKTDTTQSRRAVFSYLQDKVSSQVLFSEVAEKVADRPGGYTRIIKLGNRLGDNAEIALIELVDFNDLYTQSEEKTKSKTRRSRRGGKKKSSSSEDSAQAAAVDTAPVDTAAVDTTSTDDTAATEAPTEGAVADEVSTASAGEEAAAPSSDEQTPVVEVNDDGDTVEVSGEAVVGEPVVVEEPASEEETTEADTPTEEEPQAEADDEPSAEADDEDSKDKA